MENVQKAINITSVVIFKPSAPNPFQNKTIYTSTNISRSQYGVKCAKCSRTFDIKCMEKGKTITEQYYAQLLDKFDETIICFIATHILF
jgi:hypothetical protein